MMKFVLILIAVILTLLGVYTYSNQSAEKSSPTPNASEKKEEAKEEIPLIAKNTRNIKSNVVSAKDVVSDKKEDLNYSNAEIKSYKDDVNLLDDSKYEPNVNRTSDVLMTDEDFKKAESDTLRNQYLNSDIDIVEDADSIDLREITES